MDRLPDLFSKATCPCQAAGQRGVSCGPNRRPRAFGPGLRDLRRSGPDDPCPLAGIRRGALRSQAELHARLVPHPSLAQAPSRAPRTARAPRALRLPGRGRSAGRRHRARIGSRPERKAGDASPAEQSLRRLRSGCAPFGRARRLALPPTAPPPGSATAARRSAAHWEEGRAMRGRTRAQAPLAGLAQAARLGRKRHRPTGRAARAPLQSSRRFFLMASRPESGQASGAQASRSEGHALLSTSVHLSREGEDPRAQPLKDGSP